MLAGATSYRGIVITFLSVHRNRLNRVFGTRLRCAPAVNTLRALFLALDPEELEAAFRRHAQHLDRAHADGPRAVALEGKTLRRSFDRLHETAPSPKPGGSATRLPPSCAPAHGLPP